MLCCFLACSHRNTEPSIAAIDATLDREGDYVITDMIWLDNPSMSFELNGDSVPHLLYEELQSFKNKFVGENSVSFHEFVDGYGMAYEGYCHLDLPHQNVRKASEFSDNPINDLKELTFTHFAFEGNVYQDGSVSWSPGRCNEDISTYPVLTAVYTDANIKACEAGKLEVEFAYRVYFTESREFLEGPVLVKLKRE